MVLFCVFFFILVLNLEVLSLIDIVLTYVNTTTHLYA